MAKRKLTPEEKANFAARNAASKKSTATAKAKAAGLNPDAIKKSVNARSASQIEAAIAKAKADPKWMAKQKAMDAALKKKAAPPKVTKKPTTRGRGGSMRGGSLGSIGGGGGMNWDTK